MQSPVCRVRRVVFALASALVLSLPVSANPDESRPSQTTPIAHEAEGDQHKLETGDVVIESQEINGIRYVSGRIWVNETPEKTWRILTNPFEFERKICHRMKSVEVLTDEPALSVLDCSIGVFFPIPDFRYVVESRYTAFSQVEFHRVSGCFKDFRGFWGLRPVDATHTEITYSMYLDPGIPLPDWLVRQGLKCELPTVLCGLRDRISCLKNNGELAEKRTLQACHATACGAATAPVTASAR